MLLSVIIPTHNRTELLLQVVDGLLQQAADVNERLEIVIVDDGSTQDVKTALNSFFDQHTHRELIRYFYQSSKGPAAARNLGIQKARGNMVLFLGDDILPSPGLLEIHITAHTQEYKEDNVAVLGMAELSPEFRQTPFARWWCRKNFRYWILLEKRRPPDYSFFYTNNLSLKRAFLLQYGMFDEDFPYAAYEDGELGARLIRQGLKLVFKPEAKANHHHEINLATACRRMIVRGRAYDLFMSKTGGLPGMSKVWLLIGKGPWMSHIIIRPLFKVADWAQDRLSIGLVYTLVLMYCFLIGRGKKPTISEVN